MDISYKRPLFCELKDFCGVRYAEMARWVRVGTFVGNRDDGVCGNVVVRKYPEGELEDFTAHLAVLRFDGVTEHYHYSPEDLERAWKPLPCRIGIYSEFARNLLGRELFIPPFNNNPYVLEVITSVKWRYGHVFVNGMDEDELCGKAYLIHPCGMHVPFGIPLINKSGRLEEPLDIYAKKGGDE